MKHDRSEVIFLKGKKVIMRPPESSDITRLQRWANAPEIRRFLRRQNPLDEYGEKAWLEELHKKDDQFLFVITTHSGQPIGSMSLRINWKDRCAFTGAIIGEKKYRNNGYGTDAKLLLLSYAFDTLNMHKVSCEVTAFNARSIAYNLHCGYRKEGVFVDEIFVEGAYHDIIRLAVFRETWRSIWEHYRTHGVIPRKTYVQ